jgi:hypothetical protein
MGTQKSRGASVLTTKSGFQVGAEYVERLKRYFADVASEGRPLPARGGKPNASASRNAVKVFAGSRGIGHFSRRG